MGRQLSWHWRFFLLGLFCVSTTSTAACIGTCDMFAQPVRITGEYYIANNEFGTSILTPSGRSTYSRVVGPDIIDFDWNESFIVVKQNPREELGEPDAGVIKWYIIDVINRRTIGSMSYLDYLKKREDLSVPNDLEMLEPEDELRDAQLTPGKPSVSYTARSRVPLQSCLRLWSC